MQVSELFWNASLDELKRGFIEEKEHYICLLCGVKFEKGIIYPEDGVLYEAEKYIRQHIEKDHGSVFGYLTKLDQKLTGITDHQKNLLQLFYQGKSDAEIKQEMGIGSASTVRNHRYALKQRERQSKIFLVLMELLEEKDKHAPAFVDIPKNARMVDDRYNVTHDENDEILKKYFPDGTDGKLKTFAIKEKYKLVVLREIVKKFDSERTYTEREMNQVLKEVYDDYVVLRRYLVDYGFFSRKADGSQYWLKK